MIKELVNFSQSLNEDFKSLGKEPKEGLHILIQIKENDELNLSVDSIRFEYYNKKMEEISPFLKSCIQFQENSWMIDAYKTFDAPAKAIHTCQPFALGFKREYLEGGKKFISNVENEKSQVFERFESYFEKAAELLGENEDELVKNVAQSFSSFFIN